MIKGTGTEYRANGLGTVQPVNNIPQYIGTGTPITVEYQNLKP